MGEYKFVVDSVESWCARYSGEKFHALLCDPPYHLTPIVQRFGKPNSAPAKYGQDGLFQRISKGFMGHEWDGGDVSFRPETWAALADHLYPGAFGMAFAGSRTHHRIAVAIEDAGLIIHPQIYLWGYGSGMPKATRIDKKVDAGISEAWSGHRYGLGALKPAAEPIIVFQKPYEGRPLDCLIETGAGALNIDGSRIDAKGESYVINTFDDGAKPFGGGAGHEYTSRQESSGRWPANLILEHHPDCKPVGIKVVRQESGSVAGTEPSHTGESGIYHEYGRVPFQRYADEDGFEAVQEWECVEGCPVKLLDEQSGKSKSTGGRSGHTGAYHGGYNQEYYGDQKPGYGDTGGASRYFYQVSWQLEQADPVFYSSKAGREEREAGLIGNIPCEVCGNFDSVTHDKDGKEEKCIRCAHPTVKPISLTRYLATQLLPPGIYAPRRLLVPFAGVASEMIGAILAGWEYVLGVELGWENEPIALNRLEFWSKGL